MVATTLLARRLPWECTGDELLALRRAAASARTTLPTFVLGLFAVALSRRFAGERFAVLSPLAERGHDAFQGTIGLLTQTIPVPVPAVRDLDLLAAVAAVQRAALAAYAHAAAPAMALYDAAHRSLGGFDPVFVWNQAATGDPLAGTGLRLRPHAAEDLPARFDLRLEAHEEGDTVRFVLEGRAAQFAESELRRLQRACMDVFAEAVEAACGL